MSMYEDPRILRERLDDLEEELREVETQMASGDDSIELQHRHQELFDAIAELEHLLGQIGMR